MQSQNQTISQSTSPEQFKAVTPTKCHEPKIFKFGIKKRKFIIEENSQTRCSIIHSGKWTKEEHIKFLNACMIHGNNWLKVNIYIIQ